MSRIRPGALAFTAAVAIASMASVHGQALPANVRACASEKDDAHRLSCYDREISQMGKKGDVAEAVPAHAAPAAPEDKFGYRGQVARDELDRQAAERGGTDRLDATIRELSSRPLGERVVTLDNGQIWVQKSPGSKIRLKVGDRVAIKKASFGSFMLVTPTGRTMRVIRVQ